jgi:hypothetical protein
MKRCAQRTQRLGAGRPARRQQIAMVQRRLRTQQQRQRQSGGDRQPPHHRPLPARGALGLTDKARGQRRRPGVHGRRLVEGGVVAAVFGEQRGIVIVVALVVVRSRERRCSGGLVGARLGKGLDWCAGLRAVPRVGVQQHLRRRLIIHVVRSARVAVVGKRVNVGRRPRGCNRRWLGRGHDRLLLQRHRPGGVLTLQIEQAFEGAEDRAAAAAADPAFGRLELVLLHAEHRAAGAASCGQAHPVGPSSDGYVGRSPKGMWAGFGAAARSARVRPVISTQPSSLSATSRTHHGA